MGYFLGIDIGSSSTKGVLIDPNKKIVYEKVIRSKPRHKDGLECIFSMIKKESDTNISHANFNKKILYCMSTGYGRKNVDIANQTITEISCHAKGAHYYYPQAQTVLDIGGQDSKVIRLNKSGNVIDFVMNEKCAAGTGRFLELASKILKIPYENFGEISLKAKKDCKISSTCVVFAESEIISKLAEGVEYQSILKAMHTSVVSRLLSMGKRIGIKPPVVFTGGLANNIGVAHEIVNQLNITNDELFVPPNPKTIGAFGASLFAHEEYMYKKDKKLH